MDDKRNLIVHTEATNTNDGKALHKAAAQAKHNLQLEQSDSLVLLADKGYHTGGEFDYVDKQGVEVLVAIPDPGSHAPDPDFDIEHFVYDKQNFLPRVRNTFIILPIFQKKVQYLVKKVNL